MKKGLFTRIKGSFFEGNNYVGHLSHISDCHVGRMTYIGSKCSILHTKIGRFCSIAGDVKIIYGKHPVQTWVSTHPAFYSKNNACGVSFVQENLLDEFDYADEKKRYMVEIGNDVWICSNALITGGVRVGDGAVILAGAVVTKDVAPYSIVGGVPAKEIGKRFDDDEIVFLLKEKWWERDLEDLKRNADQFRDIEVFKNNDNI